MRHVAIAALILGAGLSVAAVLRERDGGHVRGASADQTSAAPAFIGVSNRLAIPARGHEAFGQALLGHAAAERFSNGVAAVGSGAPIGPRGDAPVCPDPMLVSQPVSGPTNFIAGVSDLDSGFTRVESFAGAAGRIEAITWWGLDLAPQLGGGFAECTEPTPQFEILFFEDDDGRPGAQVRSHILLATRTDTGLSYNGAQLNEYHVTLPEPLILARGWLSIVGLGDFDCRFLWMSSPAGDGRSLCQFCGEPEQTFDLCFCLHGTAGGVFGACCDASTGVCTDNAPIASCTGPGQRFYADTSCANAPTTCEIIRGACCFGDGTCAEIPYAQCLSQGGEWLGAFSTCGQCPALGACCFDAESCIVTTQEVCDDEGHTWLGPNTSCADCPATPVCSDGALVSQSPDGPREFLAGTSEMGTGVKRFENFSGVGGAIDRMVWWGVDLVRVGPTWIECVEFDPTFEITFHEDAGGTPGPAVCSYVLLATRTPATLMYNGTELNEYEALLPAPCVLTRGWVSIHGLGDPDCWFLWMSAGAGYSWCEGCHPNQQDQDYSMCLFGTFGGIFGACCDDAAGQCRDEVEISNCLGSQQRFVPNAGCGDLDPPCGVVPGACCFANASCAALEEADCLAQGGLWLGAGVPCSQCPCLTPCAAGAAVEGEPDCFPGYVDAFNGGCFAEPPVFSPMQFARPVCGRSGVWELGDAMPDIDWYEIEIDEFTELTLTVEAEFPVRAVIIDGRLGCEQAETLAIGVGRECETAVASAFVFPGRHWLVILPDSFSDLAQCGARYVATVTRPATCPGDVDGDDDVDLTDLAILLSHFGLLDMTRAEGDLDGDTDVDLTDLAMLLAVFGSACE